PTPHPVPGSVAIATVRVADAVYSNELVYRFLSGWAAIELGYNDLADDEVTDVQRAVVVTEADVEDLLGDWDDQWPDEAYEYFREWFAAKLEGGAA
ncbi:hypothetical protein, partial [Jiangella anatolica]